jgi:hypothetical protein
MAVAVILHWRQQDTVRNAATSGGRVDRHSFFLTTKNPPLPEPERVLRVWATGTTK